MPSKPIYYIHKIWSRKKTYIPINKQKKSLKSRVKDKEYAKPGC